MANVFKNIGKGIGYFFLFPLLIIAIAVYSVFGLLVFIFQLFKLIFLFFTGRTLFSDLPEDIELKALLNTTADSASPTEEKKEEQPQYVYQTAAYVSPAYDKKEETPAPSATQEASDSNNQSQVIDEPPEEKTTEGGDEQ